MNSPSAVSERPASPLKALAVTFGVAFGGAGVAVVVFLWVLGLMRERHVGVAWVMVATIVYAAAILGVTFAGIGLGRRFGCATPTAAARRYQRRFMVAITAYVLTLIASISLYVFVHPAAWLAWPMALAPAIPIIGMVVVMGLYLREETDELERAIHSEAALWATGGLLAICTIWGFLEQFGLVVHVVSWIAFPVWAVCLGPANAIIRRRYR
jgi:hypothetical protein